VAINQGDLSMEIDHLKIEKNLSVERLQLYSQLFLYGDFIPLDFYIDPNQVHSELAALNDKWVPYNIQRGDTGREGLSVTSLDGGFSGWPDLQSLYQYSNETGIKVSENDFNKLTAVYDLAPSLRPILQTFKPYLGRSRFVRFKAGGHFPPHRDHSVNYQVPDYFRLFVALKNTGRDRFYFIYDGKVMDYQPGRVYLFNALKTHTVFSVTDQALTLALSLRLSQEAIALTLKHLEFR